MNKSFADYRQLLATVKEHIQTAQVKTIVAANSQMLWLYWQLGDYILQNQNAAGWGTKVIDKLSSDIHKAFPLLKGFSVRNLKYMRKFAEVYSLPVLQKYQEAVRLLKDDPTIVQQVVALLEMLDNKSFIIVQQVAAQMTDDFFPDTIVSKVGWSHHMILMDKTVNYAEKFWYLLNTLENGISRNVLAMQIDSALFQRQVKATKVSNFSNTLPAIQTDFATYMLKDPYIFDFVQARATAQERDIEQQLTEHITHFLLELGQGFAFVGKQVHFEVGGKDFYIDLLFYHIKLRAYVVIELKAGEFEPGDAGQLNFYISLVNDKLKTANDNDSIGILLCKGKSKVLAEYALKGMKQPIGVSDYQLSKAVPAELKSQLPDIYDLENELFLGKIREI